MAHDIATKRRPSFITNYIETTDIPMEDTIADYINFAYFGGPKPRLLEMNGL